MAEVARLFSPLISGVKGGREWPAANLCQGLNRPPSAHSATSEAVHCGLGLGQSRYSPPLRKLIARWESEELCGQQAGSRPARGSLGRVPAQSS